MAAELILVPEAEQDIGEAYDWYEHRRQGLGEELPSHNLMSSPLRCRWCQKAWAIPEGSATFSYERKSAG